MNFNVFFIIFTRKQNFKFSFFSLICPATTGNLVYKKALKNIYEYIGIENIIKRLQDIDKLKLILFNKEQRKFFEQLPKPGVARNISKKDSSFTIDSIVKSKRHQINENEPFQQLKLSMENDPMNKRLYDLMESRKSLTKNNNFGIKFIILT